MRAQLRNEAGETIARIRLPEEHDLAKAVVTRDGAFIFTEVISERGANVRIFVAGPIAAVDESLEYLVDKGEELDARAQDEKVPAEQRDLYVPVEVVAHTFGGGEED